MMAMKGKHHLTCMGLNGGRILRYRGQAKGNRAHGESTLETDRGGKHYDFAKEKRQMQ